MPDEIGRDQLRTLTGQGAPLVEVLPAAEYDWAHLPGAVSMPLKELDARAGQMRSEERRVGKECRSRWSPYH